MSRRWWTKEPTDLHHEASKIGRKASKFKNDPTNPLHAKSAKAKKEYKKAIEYNKKHHWRDWLEKVNNSDIWTTHRYISALGWQCIQNISTHSYTQWGEGNCKHK